MATKYAELIAIANALAGEDVGGQHPRTVAGAIDAITDALAGEDVDSGGTIASAIAALAPYAEGGGGGADLGETVSLTASEELEDFACEIRIGEDYVVDAYVDGSMPVAAGVSVYIRAVEGRTGTYQIGSAEPQEMESITVVIPDEPTVHYLYFTIPADTPAETAVTVDGQF